MSEWSGGPAWLFCPADRPDRYTKAVDRADMVILDLEDAVAPDHKEAARDSVRHLAQMDVLDRRKTVLRVNPTGTPDHEFDVSLVAETGIDTVMLAKAEHANDAAAIECAVIALVETPRGVRHADLLAESPNVVGLMWGADDLVAGLGGTSSRHSDGTYRDVAQYARSTVLIAAKAADRFVLDGVHMDIADLDGLRSECLDGAAVGFDGSVAIHPSQVPVIRRAYAPEPAELEWATRLLDFVGDGRGVTTFEGHMVDGPIIKQAQRVIRRAAACTPGSPQKG